MRPAVLHWLTRSDPRTSPTPAHIHSRLAHIGQSPVGTSSTLLIFVCQKGGLTQCDFHWKLLNIANLPENTLLICITSPNCMTSPTLVPTWQRTSSYSIHSPGASSTRQSIILQTSFSWLTCSQTSHSQLSDSTSYRLGVVSTWFQPISP